MKVNQSRKNLENPIIWDTKLWDQKQEDHSRAKLVWDWLGNAKNILDVGCGNGVLQQFAPIERVEIGIDEAFSALQINPYIKSQESALFLPFANSAFEAVDCLEVLEHI